MRGENNRIRCLARAADALRVSAFKFDGLEVYVGFVFHMFLVICVVKL